MIDHETLLLYQCAVECGEASDTSYSGEEMDIASQNDLVINNSDSSPSISE